MKRLLITLILLTILTSVWAGGAKEKMEPADMVLTNTAVYTVDNDNNWAEAMAVTGGRITAVGSVGEIKKYIGDSTEVFDLEGKMVMPAFVDAHMHPAMSAVAYLFQISLQSVFSLEEYLAVISAFVDENPDLETYQGAGYMRSVFDEIGPRKEDLDAIAPYKPMALTSVDGHSMWVNSRALKMAGITKATPDPAGGVIKRDPATGEPSGLLQESAMGLVSDLFPEPTKEMYKEGILWLQEWFNTVGLTTCHDAAVSFDPNYYMAYEELARDGLLTIRFRGSWFLSPEMVGGAYGMDATGDEEMTVDEAIELGMKLSDTFETPYWQVKSFKFFSDQVIEEETGLLKEPYSHRDDNWYGIQVWDPEFLKEAFRKVDAEGYNIHIHQIGDAAADYALDALEYAREKNGSSDSRHTFAHLQMTDQSEIDRMAALGMNAIIAPYWMIVDDYYWDLYLPYLGEQRAYNEMYPAQSLFDAGVNTAIHSDFFVTEPDYGWALYSAMTRTMPEKVFRMWYGEDADSMIRTTEYSDEEMEYYTMGPLGPSEERISLADAIKASTINGAYADFLDEDLGSIEVGKLADIIVIDRNLFEIDTEEVANLEVLMTLFEGKIVYSAE
ncbi:MAG: amidohydrolase [Spirochaetales bacterium]|nr:amidohydrolase [Spirochaetales bacterium]